MTNVEQREEVNTSVEDLRESHEQPIAKDDGVQVAPAMKDL